MIRVGSIVVRVDDLQRQAEFWTAALDYERREGDSDDFLLLRERDVQAVSTEPSPDGKEHHKVPGQYL